MAPQGAALTSRLSPAPGMRASAWAALYRTPRPCAALICGVLVTDGVHLTLIPLPLLGGRKHPKTQLSAAPRGQSAASPACGTRAPAP